MKRPIWSLGTAKDDGQTLGQPRRSLATGCWITGHVRRYKEYAKAIAAYQGNWVPSIVNGSGAGQAVAGSGAMQMLEILSAKAAKDLAIDMSVSGTGKTAGKK